MSVFFFLQLSGFFSSLIILTHWINSILFHFRCLRSSFLPCFAWGWFLYFLIYMVGRWFAFSVETVQMLFTSLAFGVPLISLLWYYVHPGAQTKTLRAWINLPLDKGTLVLVALFVGAMIYIGPYLEYPSDPLFHLFSTQIWESTRAIDTASGRQARFAYILNHWLLQSSGLSLGKREGVALLGAVLQGILLWEFIRFTRLFTPNIWIGWLGGIASLGFFGTSAFSFFRYYVLAPTFPAYIVFLEAVIWMLFCFFRQRLFHLVLLLPLIAFCWQNHNQEVLLLVNIGAGTGLFLLIYSYRTTQLPTLSSKFKKLLTGMICVGVVGTVLVALLVESNPGFQSYQDAHKEKFLMPSYHLLGWQMWFYRFSRIDQALGLAGWLAMIGAAWIVFFAPCSRKLYILAGICLWPLIVLWNPLFIEILLKQVPSDTLYRLFYGSFYWILLVLLLEYLNNRYFNSISFFHSHLWQRYFRNLSLLFFPAAILLIGLSFYAHTPIRGRMPHLFTKVDTPQLNGQNLTQTIAYLRDNVPSHCTDSKQQLHFPIRTHIFSDPYVNTYLGTTGYFYTISNRWGPFDVYNKMTGSKNFNPLPFLQFLKTQEICYVILYPQNNAPDSHWADVSGHWLVDYANTHKYYSSPFLKWVQNSPEYLEPVFQDGIIRIYKVL